MNVLAKVFGVIINEKVIQWAEGNKIWGEEEAGFRKGRGGLENLLVIRDLIEKSKATGKCKVIQSNDYQVNQWMMGNCN